MASVTEDDSNNNDIEGSSDLGITDTRTTIRKNDEELQQPPKQQPLNKENVSLQTTTASPVTPSSLQARGLSNRPEFPLPTSRTPTARLQQLSLTPKQRPHLETGPVRVVVPKTPKRMLATGPVRIEPRKPSSVEKKSPPRRVGYDGTPNTPSRELLKSTASSRSHQIHPPTPPPVTVEELDGSLDSSLVRSPMTTITTREEEFRRGCENPVAMTLLNNNGTEDLDLLLARDVSSPVVSASPVDFLPVSSSDDDECGGDDSTVVSCPSILKVSSSLLDVMDQSDLETLAKPVPFRACRSTP